VLAVDSAARVELPNEAYAVTRTSAERGVACTRSAWTITCPAGIEPPADGLLRIGVPFCLCSTGLYLQSARYTLHNQNFAKAPGVRKQGSCAVPSMSADTLWTVRVLDPTDLAQMESDGAPVPANTFISLVHVNTQIALFTEAATLPNKYGGEHLVSAFSDGTLNKGEFGKRNGKMLGAGNHWAFTTAAADA